MLKWLLIIAFLIGLFLQGTITSIPIVLDIILLYYIYKRDLSIYLIAFLMGIVIDVLLIGQIGLSSLCFVFFLFIIGLYEKKFEINSAPFVFASTFFGSAIYLFLYNYSGIFIKAIVSSFFALLFFQLMSFLQKDRNQDFKK